MPRSRKRSFIIDRTVWFRGRAEENSTCSSSALWTGEKGRSMCCLGQIAQQCGVQKRHLKNAVSPIDLSEITLEKLPKWMQPNVNIIHKFMVANDNILLDDKQREKRLHTLAKHAGITLTFIN